MGIENICAELVEREVGGEFCLPLAHCKFHCSRVIWRAIDHVEGVAATEGCKPCLKTQGDDFLLGDAVGAVHGVSVIDGEDTVDEEGVFLGIIAASYSFPAGACGVVGVDFRG